MVFLKKYWPAVLLALLVGLFSILPLVLSLQRMDNEFAGIWPQFNSDANFYLARIHEVTDGHADMNNPYLFEHKEETYPQANGGELFLAWLAQILQVSIPAQQAALTFIAPAIMAVLTYFLLVSLYPNRASAFALSLIFFTVITGGMTKPVHPGVSFPLLLLFLLSWFILVFKKEHRGVYTVLCGVLLGFLFLTYFFHWSFLLVALGLYGMLLFWRKDYTQLKHHVIFIVIALLIATPYLLRVVTGVDTPLYEAMALRMGVFATHWPETFPRLGVALAWFVFFVFFVRSYQLNNDIKAHILLVLLAANIIYPNHQVITGITVENANHWSLMPVFLYMLVGHYMFFIIFVRARGTRRAFNATLVVLAVIMLAVPARRLQSFNFPPYQRSLTQPRIEEQQQRYTAVMDWINTNTKADDVIFSHLALMQLIPVYTHANIYYSENAPYLIVSDTEVIERTLLYHFFDIDNFKNNDFNMNEVSRILWTQPAMIEGNTHWLHDLLGVAYEKRYTLKRELNMVRGVLSELENAGWSINLLQRYRLDYIIWDKDIASAWRLDDYDELEKVYEKDNIAVFVFR